MYIFSSEIIKIHLSSSTCPNFCKLCLWWHWSGWGFWIKDQVCIWMGALCTSSSQLSHEDRNAEDPCVPSCHCLLRTGLSEHWLSLIFALILQWTECCRVVSLTFLLRATVRGVPFVQDGSANGNWWYWSANSDVFYSWVWSILSFWSSLFCLAIFPLF